MKAFSEREDVAKMSKQWRSLTLREREVMLQVIRGRLNKQIAGDLNIVEKTVKVHRARVMEKMGVRSVAGLVHIAEKLQRSGCAEFLTTAFRYNFERPPFDSRSFPRNARRRSLAYRQGPQAPLSWVKRLK